MRTESRSSEGITNGSEKISSKILAIEVSTINSGSLLGLRLIKSINISTTHLHEEKVPGELRYPSRSTFAKAGASDRFPLQIFMVSLPIYASLTKYCKKKRE